jgi:hypothetical protein
MLFNLGNGLNMSEAANLATLSEGQRNNIHAADKGGFAVCWLERSPVRQQGLNGSNAPQGLSVWNSGLSSVNEAAFMINF